LEDQLVPARDCARELQDSDRWLSGECERGGQGDARQIEE